MRAGRRALCALLCGLFLWGCGGAEDRFDGTGRVISLDRDQHVLKLAHGPIPGLMPAMTMTFDVAPGVNIGELKPGDAVRFVLERTPGHLRIVRLTRGGPGVSYGITDVQEEEGDVSGVRLAAPFRLTDQDGRPFDSKSLAGRAVLLDFIFTTCTGPCPILTAAHARLQGRLPAAKRDRVRFVSITVDPENDTPGKLRQYALSHGADLTRWSFLTGTPEEVDAVLRAYHVGRVPRADKTLNHTVVTYLIDPAGKIRNYYLGLEHAHDAVLADILEVIS